MLARWFFGPIGVIVLTLLFSLLLRIYLPLHRVVEPSHAFLGILLAIWGILLSQMAKRQFVSGGIPTRRSYPSTKLETRGVLPIHATRCIWG